MCGIAGIFSLNKAPIVLDKVKRMTDVLQYRGPDGEGQWLNDDQLIGLGHRRLSIIDLSEHAAQPMLYANRYTIVYNGEIYNYIELKKDLLKKGYTFTSESDTEVLLALYAEYGSEFLQLLDGMFAMAIWDEQEKTLFCARDRFGEKPFYYSVHDGALYFASEMKALWGAGVPRICNQEMLYYYLEFGLVHHPSDKSATFYKHINKLPAANYFKISTENTSIKTSLYWSLDSVVQNHPVNDDEAAEQFQDLLKTSINRRLRSDVPVGSSLSGGLDSSAIVCLIDKMNENNGFSQNTFSARFSDWGKDEGKFMESVIAQTSVTPHFTYPDEKGFIDNFDSLCWHQEEPFGSSSIYAQYCVMKLAADNNTIVLLDGQGADEMLAGYHYYYKSYFKELKANKQFQTRSSEIASYKAMSGGAKNLPFGWKEFIATNFPAIKNRLLDVKHGIEKYMGDRYSSDFLQLTKHYHRSPNSFTDLNTHLKSDMVGGNLEDLLRYCDRNSMAHSREVRLPFLSHELCEFIFALPSNFKIRNGWTKWIQRKSLETILPPEITWRKDKIGYEPPQKKWMENPAFKELIIENKRKLFKEGIITKKEAEKSLKATSAHSKGDNSWAYLMAGKLF